MQKLGMRCLVVLMCSGLACAWGTNKSQEKGGNEQEQNKAVVRQVFDEVLNRGRAQLMDQLYDANCKVHQGGKTMTLADAVTDGEQWRSAAPDMKLTPESMQADKDRVTVHWTARGTNTGQGHGTPGKGKPVVVHGESVFRLANGKIVEVWNNFNEREVVKQTEEGGKRH